MWALDPGQYHVACFAHQTLLPYISKISEKILAPPRRNPGSASEQLRD